MDNGAENGRALKKRFEKAITTFTKIAQAQTPQENLTRALVLADDLDEHARNATSSLSRRWQNLCRGQVLAADSDQTSQSPPAVEDLDDVARRVMQAWRKFARSLPKEQSAELENKPPDLRFLQQAVQDANASFETKREGTGIKQGFQRVCNAFGNYQHLAGILPDGDMYLCLISGGFGAMIKASVNHANIAESVSKALVEISEDMSFCGRLIIQHPVNETMRSYIRQLYALIFECFTDIFTEWHRSSWSRIRHSFNPDALARIVDRPCRDMRVRLEWLQREAQLENTSEMRQTYQSVIDLHQTHIAMAGEVSRLTTFNENMERHFFSMSQQQIALVRTGKQMQQTLRAGFLRIESDRLHITELEGSSRESSGSREFPAIPAEVEMRYSKADLQQAIRVYSEPLATVDYQKASSFVWIEGPADVEEPSVNTLTSVSLVGIAQKSAIPYVAYFAEPVKAPDEVERAKRASKTVAALVTTLIWQIVNALPEDIEVGGNFSQKRFACLAGHNNVAAVKLLGELLQVFPLPLICVLDGLQHLDRGKEATRALRKLVEVLCTARSADGVVRRVCCTTNGFSSVLGRQERPLNRVTYDVERHAGDTGLEVLSVAI
ncbi:uncharacterized protein AB675_3562 [Cyphellophora attinorum]|uniref:DUF7708 domain-containing protein n=1 Tax=Cyphellophora attinorum TaxID=1664694 RepID=A0A0N0NM17_9EURO|nr:uncharacterized protein AB675_3562 [Phialophora attinorum]KPI39828.1 hypothetical protein AB675_3562 [Phialophora attinorum]